MWLSSFELLIWGGLLTVVVLAALQPFDVLKHIRHNLEYPHKACTLNPIMSLGRRQDQPEFPLQSMSSRNHQGIRSLIVDQDILRSGYHLSGPVWLIQMVASIFEFFVICQCSGLGDIGTAQAAHHSSAWIRRVSSGAAVRSHRWDRHRLHFAGPIVKLGLLHSMSVIEAWATVSQVLLAELVD